MYERLVSRRDSGLLEVFFHRRNPALKKAEQLTKHFKVFLFPA